MQITKPRNFATTDAHRHCTGGHMCLRACTGGVGPQPTARPQRDPRTARRSGRGSAPLRPSARRPQTHRVAAPRPAGISRSALGSIRKRQQLGSAPKQKSRSAEIRTFSLGLDVSEHRRRTLKRLMLILTLTFVS